MRSHHRWFGLVALLFLMPPVALADALHEAIDEGDRRRAAKILSRDREAANRVGRIEDELADRTPLHRAVGKGDSAMAPPGARARRR